MATFKTSATHSESFGGWGTEESPRVLYVNDRFRAYTEYMWPLDAEAVIASMPKYVKLRKTPRENKVCLSFEVGFRAEERRPGFVDNRPCYGPGPLPPIPPVHTEPGNPKYETGHKRLTAFLKKAECEFGLSPNVSGAYHTLEEFLAAVASHGG